MDIFADLEAEDDRLEQILAGLTDEQWLMPSAALGWTIADVMLHLAQSDELVLVTTSAPAGSPSWRNDDDGMDDVIEAMVRSDPATPSEVFARWKAARRASVEALRNADPQAKFGWAAAPLKPTTLATTRLAEHWAHALDIADPLGIDLADTDRLRHIAWLGHGTLPYALRLVNVDPQPVRCELTSPGGDTWYFGPDDTPSRIVGSASEFCRVGAQRLAPADSNLLATGPVGAEALRVLRNYAA